MSGVVSTLRRCASEQRIRGLRSRVYGCADCGVRAAESGHGDARAAAAAIIGSGFRGVDGLLYCAKHAKSRGYLVGAGVCQGGAPCGMSTAELEEALADRRVSG